jgi:hypothetical protein
MSDTERMIPSALKSWNQVIARLDQRLLNLTDEQLERQVSPERVFEKCYVCGRQFSMRRMAAISMSVSDVCILSS